MKDLETIQTELILADLQTIQKRLFKAKSDAKSGDKEKITYSEMLEKVFQTLDSGKLAHSSPLEEEEFTKLHDLHLLTMKPEIFVFNVSEDQLSKQADLNKRIDEILDKITRSGYQNLTEEEKKILFEAIKKLN